MTKSDIETARRVLRSEAEGLGRLAEMLDEGFESCVDICLAAKGRIICAGIGKSGHVARKIAATLASTGTPAQFVHPTEASHGDLGMITQDDVVLALSRSGETPELSDLLHYAKRFSIPLIGMTSNPQSALGKAVDHQLLVPDIAEACAITNAPTTSTTLMMALGDALAVALLERKDFKSDDFRTYHPGGKLGAMLKTVEEIMRSGDAVPLVATGTPFKTAIAELTEKRLGCVGVVNDQRHLLGILTDGDIRRLVLERRDYDIIDDVMTENPITIEKTGFAHRAISLMSERNIMQLFALDDDRCVGIVHMHDILKAGVV